jgi:hypothetical protein
MSEKKIITLGWLAVILGLALLSYGIIELTKIFTQL